MTCREKLKIEHPERVNNEDFRGGCWGCPHDYGYLPVVDCDLNCTECWDREIPGTPINIGTDDLIRINDELLKENDRLHAELKEAHRVADEKDIIIADLKERFEKYESSNDGYDKKAAVYRKKFRALRGQGFTDEQAMSIIINCWTDH
jgi:hypothetical protein